MCYHKLLAITADVLSQIICRLFFKLQRHEIGFNAHMLTCNGNSVMLFARFFLILRLYEFQVIRPLYLTLIKAVANILPCRGLMNNGHS